MTTYRGNAGVFKYATNAVAELTGFSLNTSTGTIEDTVQGDTARTYVADGLPTFSGTIRGRYYPGDTNGQAVLIEGATGAAEFHPSGTTTGLQKLSGTIIITGDVITSNNGEIVSFEANFQGTGALTRAANS